MIQQFKFQHHPIEFDLIDGEVLGNGTLMAASHGRRINDYVRLQSTKSYIAALEKRYGISRNGMIVVKQGGTGQGTWLSEKLVLDLARWCSPDFAVWCDERLAEMIRQSTMPTPVISPSIENLQTQLEALQQTVLQIQARTEANIDAFTIVGFASLNNLRITFAQAVTLGKKASSLCKMHSIEIAKTRDPRFGIVNVYPSEVLREVFGETLPKRYLTK